MLDVTRQASGNMEILYFRKTIKEPFFTEIRMQCAKSYISACQAKTGLGEDAGPDQCRGCCKEWYKGIVRNFIQRNRLEELSTGRGLLMRTPPVHERKIESSKLKESHKGIVWTS